MMRHRSGSPDRNGREDNTFDDAMLDTDGVRSMRRTSILSFTQQGYQLFLFTCRSELLSNLVGA
ncbi:hypothetical protein [Ferrimicrobium sp.]|uniref:hypothetical protein n=1 Tax=Ferrimicrobium sp. TaxID=2926050 RepID=UPI00261778BB|nr:hypothetical protein [Ferrimicrobium sp.]